jgi:hypothetical protein
LSKALVVAIRQTYPDIDERLSQQELSVENFLKTFRHKETRGEMATGVLSGMLIEMGMIRVVAHGDVAGFRSLVREGVHLVLSRIEAENASKDRGQMYSSLLEFRSIAQLLAIGEYRDARSLANLLNEDLTKRRTFVPWVKSMGLQFIHLVRDDRAALQAVADEAIKSRSKKLGSAKYYAMLSHAIARRDAAAAAAAIPQVLIGHRLDCDPEGDVDFATSAAGQALCLYGLAMVNAAAMHGFRVPLNGDVQIPEELVVVPPESV